MWKHRAVRTTMFGEDYVDGWMYEINGESLIGFWKMETGTWVIVHAVTGETIGYASSFKEAVKMSAELLAADRSSEYNALRSKDGKSAFTHQMREVLDRWEKKFGK